MTCGMFCEKQEWKEIEIIEKNKEKPTSKMTLRPTCAFEISDNSFPLNPIDKLRKAKILELTKLKEEMAPPEIVTKKI